MKAFFTLLVLISSTSWAGVRESVQLRSQNYTALTTHYSALISSIQQRDQKSFCDLIKVSLSPLSKILEDDNNFIYALRLVSNIDYYDYSVHIQDNASSPLFGFFIHQEKCTNNDLGSLESLSQSLAYDLMNIDFLSMTHELWIEAHYPFDAFHN